MAEEKIIMYRGKTLEELKAMSMEKFSELLGSDQRRKLRRGLTEQENKLLKKIRENQKNIKTHCRDMIVLPEMVGVKLSIYTGKEYVTVELGEEMIGLRLGELAPSRKIGVTHSGGGAKRTEVRK